MFVYKHAKLIESIKNSLLFKKNANSRILRITNAKFFSVSFIFILFIFYFVLFYFISFFLSTNIKGDFQIWISVPLIDFINSYPFSMFFSIVFVNIYFFSTFLLNSFFQYLSFLNIFCPAERCEFTPHCLYRDSLISREHFVSKTSNLFKTQ